MSFPNVSEDTIETVAKLAFGPDFKIKSIQFQKYSSDKVGFIGEYAILQITPKFTKTNEMRQMKTFFVKYNVSKNCAYQGVPNCNVQEVIFYSELLPKFQKWLDCPKFVPKFYFGNPDLIIMEDLRANKFTMKEKSVFNIKELQSSAIAIAQLHAVSMLTTKELGKPLNAFYPEHLKECVFATIKNLNLPSIILDFIYHLAAKKNLVSRRFAKGLNLALDYINDQQITKNHVLCHGDAWFNNFMFSDQDPPNCILVDFQISFWADQIVDLCQLLYLNADRQTRQESEKFVLESYHKEFSRIISANDQNLEFRNFDQLIEAYENNRLVGLIYAIIYYPLILLDRNVTNSYEIGFDALSDFMYRKSNDALITHLKVNHYMEQRLMEATEELFYFCEKNQIPEI